jgi:imidazoleglycerol-phosphate dehydratase/histidinol-phosphatase
MLKAFENEGILFDDIIIDKTFPQDNAETRKPKTGLLENKYMNGEYDLANSYVIGDRITDVELAKNMGAKAIWINHENKKGLKEITGKIDELKGFIAIETTDWKDIYLHLAVGERKSSVKRNTKETKISVDIDLDGSGIGQMNTGIGFF